MNKFKLNIEVDLQKNPELRDDIDVLIPYLKNLSESIDRTSCDATITASLTFDLTESDIEKRFQQMLKAPNYINALWDISQNIFRPARKHGYSNANYPVLCELAAKEDGYGEEIIAALEDMFYEILTSKGIDLDEEVF